MIDTALRRFGGDPQRVVLGGHSYGGRGILWYAAARTRTFAALVPVCPSSGPTPKVVDALCCASGEAHCCPPVWQFVGANDHRMIVDFNDDWARRLQAQAGTITLHAPLSQAHAAGTGIDVVARTPWVDIAPTRRTRDALQCARNEERALCKAAELDV